MNKKSQALSRKLDLKISDIISELQTVNKIPTIHLVSEKLSSCSDYARHPQNLLLNRISLYFAQNNISTNPPPKVLSPEKMQIEPPIPKPINKKRPRDSELEDILLEKLEKKRQTEKFLENQPSLTDLGGLSSILPLLTQLIYLPLKHTDLFTELGLSPPRGILLIGAPGSGKTALAMAIGKQVEKELNYTFFFKSATELIAGVSGESEQNIRTLFNEASNNAPSLLFIDELDSIAGKKDSASKDMGRRIVSQLLNSLDALPQNVFLIAATSRPEALDPGLRRSGRFDREICLQVPDEQNRCEILEALTRKVKKDETLGLKEIAKVTSGYVPADLQSLIREAGLLAVQRLADTKEKKPEDQQIPIYLTYNDIENAMKFVQPTAKREGFSIVPDVTWEDIGALSALKTELENSLILPIREAKAFQFFNIAAPAGVLLYGPPGCGKTLLAKAVANASKANFIAIKGPELLNKYVGESEKAVRNVFSRARTSAPCIIFFDELDALCPKRGSDGGSNSSTERVVNQFLTELDGIDTRKEVFIIAATNRPDIIDTAMLRPGRLDKLLYVPLPSAEDRIAILKALMRKSPINKDVNVEKIAFDNRCEGFSGADLGALVKEAGLEAIINKKKEIDNSDFEVSLNKVRPSLSEKDKKSYEILRENLRNKRNYIN